MLWKIYLMQSKVRKPQRSLIDMNMVQNAKIDVPILPAICLAILPLCLAQLTENYSAYHTTHASYWNGGAFITWRTPPYLETSAVTEQLL
jgi:hypothetical protein